MGSLRVLVSGGAGFIGSHLCEHLLSLGHKIWCLDNLSTGAEDNIAHLRSDANFTFLHGDVREPLARLEVDQIYNLACPASPRHYQSDPIGTMRTSVLGALNMLDLARDVGARALLASTSEVYGDPEIHPQPESYVGAVNCTGIRACYDEGKRAAETLFYDYHRQHDIEIRVARLFNSYGPRMRAGDGRVIPNFIDQALRDEPITIYGDGHQTRSFCYVDDTVRGLVALMEAKGDRVGPVNIGNPVEFTIKDLALQIVRQTGSRSPLTYMPLPQDDPRLRRPDIGLARDLLDWEPTIQLEAGLERIIEEAREKAGTVHTPRPYAARRGTLAIIGGGPAGLTAAYYALETGSALKPVVLEASRTVGGIARTESYKGYRFDIGGHRFFTKVRSVQALWKRVLPEDFLRRPRLSRIYYHGKFYAYPLRVFNALRNMGPYEAGRILLSYLKWRVRPHQEEDNFEQWVTNRFGGRLFWHFFKTYTEKVWGIPCTEIKADWAAQRIKNLSLRKAVWNAITGSNDTSSLIEEFDYPRLGPGMMWEAFRDQIVERGGEVRLDAKVVRVLHKENVVEALEYQREDGAIARIEAQQFISSMPIPELVQAMSPSPPASILAAASRLRYRDFLIVTLILDHPDPFPDNWIYIHSPDVQVGRIQNFRSWSPEMVPDADRSSIGMEYFCTRGDAIWNAPDAELISLARTELEALGLASADSVIDGTVIRQPQAYPVYDSDYREALDMIRGWLAQYRNLQVVGRNGMHRYNNQDHSMLTAMLAVENIEGAAHDLWSVNVDQSYHEDVESAPKLPRLRSAAASA